MMNTRISLVIPVFNEEDSLVDCLRSVMAQIQPFYEVIVVDNNSSDDTVAIARRFPGVTVIHEVRQGVVYARGRGFDAASGDIIARIDGDTVLPADWSQQLVHVFSGGTVAAASGKIEYYNISGVPLLNAIDVRLRRHFQRVLGAQMFLQAANMAIRKDVWLAVREHVCLRGGVHEDFDLGLHVQRAGYRVAFDERMRAAIDLRQVGGTFWSFANYFWHCPATYRQHHARRGWHLYPIILTIIAAYPFLKVLHRGYDPVARHFSWRRAYSRGSTYRVNPATYVD